jgi:hypothetical protein
VQPRAKYIFALLRELLILLGILLLCAPLRPIGLSRALYTSSCLPQRLHQGQFPSPHTFLFLVLGACGEEGVAQFHAIVLKTTAAELEQGLSVEG